MINTNTATVSGIRAKRYIKKAEESTEAETFVFVTFKIPSLEAEADELIASMGELCTVSCAITQPDMLVEGKKKK